MTPAQIKAAVRARDGMKCTKCGLSNDDHKARTGRQLEAHRVKPGSPYSVDGCVTLCKGCHGPEPRRARYSPDFASGVPVIRVSFDAKNETLRRAVYIAAAMTGKTHNEILNQLIEDNLGRYIDLARKAIDADDPPPRKPKPRPEA